MKMSGLSLLHEYSSESENELSELPKDTYPKAQSERLPLPSSISTWKGVTHHEEVVSDPSKHEGRIRSFEHERGNWAALTYIKYNPSIKMSKWMNNLKSQVNIENTHFHEEFHISLTRTLILKYHWIDSFVESMKKLCTSVYKFKIRIMNLNVYCNENETRTFLGLQCQSESSELLNLTKQLDQLLMEYKLPPFYEDASFHISFMWCLGNQRKLFEKLLPSLTDNLEELFQEYFEERSIEVDQIQCKIGNRNYVFRLKC